jgi:DUF1009 family protein
LIGGIAKILEEEAGIELIDSTAFLKPFLPAPGVLTKRRLSSAEQSDVDYGRPIAKRIAAMDIGQTIAVRDQAVIAVEAMEGTDAVIRRAGELAGKKDITIIKVSKPKQDMRFDIPVIGLSTMETMINAGATAIVIDADRTLMFDREKLLDHANTHNIAIAALPPIEN